LRCGAGSHFNAFGNKTNTIIKNENIRRGRQRLFQRHLILENRALPVFAGCARRLIAAIGRGRLMKPKIAFGRVKHGAAPPILPPGFAVCTSRKMTRTDVPLFAAGVWAQIDWVTNFAVLLKT
jgi:hypothetical protein